MTKSATPEKVTDEVEVIAIRAFAVDYNKDEKKKIEKDFKNGAARKHNWDATGMTKRIEPGEKCTLKKADAIKLQNSGAVKVAL